jgi:hypothetical protein
LRVLRVLTKYTLKIKKGVKDSLVPDPSLAKVVKDSTLTILFSSDPFKSFICEAGQIVRRVLFRRGAPEILEKLDLVARRDI